MIDRASRVIVFGTSMVKTMLRETKKIHFTSHREGKLRSEPAHFLLFSLFTAPWCLRVRFLNRFVMSARAVFDGISALFASPSRKESSLPRPDYLHKV